MITEGPKEPLGFILKGILFIISLFYFFAVKLRLALYNLRIFKAHRLSAPVISVGNITWGGTGKTPLAEAICLYFRSQDKRIALLTRGYGRDEDKILTKNMPGVSVLAGGDRVKNARSAEERGCFDIFILDDGFQHQRIRRDIDIVVINATDPFGSGFQIPAGILREPVSHLSRADLAVITRSDMVPPEALSRIKKDILKVRPDIEIFDSLHQPVSFYTGQDKELELEYIRGKRVCALSGLGDNRSFLQALKGLGADIGGEFLYMDHHAYVKSEIDEVTEDCKRDSIDTVVTTQKDWVKLKGLLTEGSCGIEFLVLKIKLKINDEKKFFSRLSSILPG